MLLSFYASLDGNADGVTSKETADSGDRVRSSRFSRTTPLSEARSSMGALGETATLKRELEAELEAARARASAIEEEENTATPTTPPSAPLLKRLTHLLQLIQSQLDELRKELAEFKAKDIQPQLDELRKELAETQQRELDALRKELAESQQPLYHELRKELAELRQPRCRRFRFFK